MLCRTCFFECIEENATSLFFNDEESQLTKLIAKYLFLEITKDDRLSTTICRDCSKHLNDFHEFFQNIEDRQQSFKQNFVELNPIGIQLGEVEIKSIPTLEHNEELIDIKDVLPENFVTESVPQIEFGYAGEAIDCTDSEAMKTAVMVESDEDIPLLQLFSSKTKIKQINKKKNSKQKIKRNVKSCKAPNTTSTKTKKIIKNVRKNEENETQNKEKKSRNGLSPEDNLKKNELIANHIQLKCEICEDILSTYKEFQIHFRDKHNRRCFITCCNKRLNKRALLFDHIQTHINPEYFKCQICNKILKSRSCLETHNRIAHSDADALKHVCDLCDKRFVHLSMLKTHMTTHTEERNHICEICNKSFKSIYIQRIHVKRMHGDCSNYICDTCGKEYRFKLSFDRHVAQHAGPLKDALKKCPICGAFVSFNYFKRHIKRHDKENVDCDICGKTYSSQIALQCHKERTHKSRKILNCTFCDKTFDRARYLKEHIDMHTGRKDYNCKFCPREFRSSANMYSHTKKVHFKQWEEEKLRQKENLYRNYAVGLKESSINI